MIKEYWEKAESGGEESEVDLEKDLHPLTYHVHSRKRLLKEAVRSLKGKRLKAMIPPLLKDTNVEILQEECLRILEDIDSESILSILDGKMAGIFDKAQQHQELEPKEEEDLNPSSSGAKSAAKKEKKKKKIGEGKKESSKKKKKQVIKEEEESKAKKKKKSKAAKKKKKKEAESINAPAPQTKSLMELLELEYRAKAIKALLKQQGVTGIDIDDAVGTLAVSTAPPSSADLTRAGHQKEAEEGKPKILKKTVKIVRRVIKKVQF
jgi:hypothetical protein